MHFQPNNLSRLRPEFTLLNDPIVTGEVVALLNEHYAFPGLPETRISVFSGPNVSSQNLKVETSAAKAFLKSREKKNAEKMLSEAQLTFALSELGQRVPRIIRSRDGQLVSSHGERCWVLYEFQDGDYFSGKENELQAAAEAFGALSLAAKDLFPPTTTDAVPHDLEKLLDLSVSKAARYPNVAELCATHRNMILKSLKAVESHQDLLNERCTPMHLDYHPLNLLMNENGVACILDLEHLKPYPIVAGLGFAGYKLIRQAMVDDDFRARESSEPRAVSTWLRGWQNSFPEDRFTPADLGVGARCRILNLIDLILNDDRFHYDLEKQIISLYEAEIIFNPSTDFTDYVKPSA